MVGDNHLRALNISTAPFLNWLTISVNNISKISLANNTDLQIVNVANNPIAQLDVAELSDLMGLDIRNTKIRMLDLRNTLVQNEETLYWIEGVLGLDSRGTSAKVLVNSPELARLAWQSKTGANVTFATK
jgi:Leucine-rich repeat (LRR) protein